MRQNGVRSPVRFPYSQGMKKGGSVKKQGYTDRKDESIAMRVKKKRTRPRRPKTLLSCSLNILIYKLVY